MKLYTMKIIILSLCLFVISATLCMAQSKQETIANPGKGYELIIIGKVSDVRMESQLIHGWNGGVRYSTTFTFDDGAVLSVTEWPPIPIKKGCTYEIIVNTLSLPASLYDVKNTTK